MNKWLFALVLSLSAGAAVASDLALIFSDLDMDGDGAISADEAGRHSALQGRFKDVDLNNDGQLDRAEYARASAAPREEV